MPLVVIGGSAGAIAPLREVVAGLGQAFPAAVLVVIHMPDDSASGLARLLGRIGPMDARFADHGAPIEAGVVYVAPPGNHLLVHEGHLVLSQGARENGTRPAIDPLFRTAARSRGPGVVSVLLSGTLDDGSAGTVAVRRAGGLTIVQDPGDAEFADMPANAIATGMVSVVAPAAAIAARVRAAAQQLAHGDGGDALDAAEPAPGPDAATDSVGQGPLGEAAVDTVDRGLAGEAADLEPPASPYACPGCGGVLYEREPAVQYLCRLGHRYSAESLGHDQESVVGDALWTALRSLDESASLAARVRDRALARGDRAMEQRFEGRRESAQARADRIRALLRTTEPADVERVG